MNLSSFFRVLKYISKNITLSIRYNVKKLNIIHEHKYLMLSTHLREFIDRENSLKN